MTSRIAGFYRLSVEQRRLAMAHALGMDSAALQALAPGALGTAVADDMIENVIGTMELPLAVALNLIVDGREVIVPMAIEEPSVVAATSNAARMARAGGGFTTTATKPVMIGQIQLTQLADPDASASAVLAARDTLLATARNFAPRLAERGGGPVDLRVRVLARPPGPDGGMLVVHLHVDCRDAMGANLVNTLCESLAPALVAITGGEVGLRILTNLTDERTVSVSAVIPFAELAEASDTASGRLVAEGIAAASRFAELDPYRAATHNKGIMNGVDAVLVATGQDWRAVEAGAHAFACSSGTYQPLATWRIDHAAQTLVGALTMPLAVGVVGGALHCHPTARLALAITGSTSATDLARLAAVAGLATNLAALRALATEGIQRGHMALHARAVARAAGAPADKLDAIAAELAASGDVKIEQARLLVARAKTSAGPT